MLECLVQTRWQLWLTGVYALSNFCSSVSLGGGGWAGCFCGLETAGGGSLFHLRL